LFFGGYKLNENKRLYDSLQKIYGIGKSFAKQVVYVLGLNMSICLKKLSYDEKLKLDRILIHYPHGFKAKRLRTDNIKLLKENKSYRGVRHTYFLSVRGQKTRTNAKTQRNKKNKAGKIKIKKKISIIYENFNKKNGFNKKNNFNKKNIYFFLFF